MCCVSPTSVAVVFIATSGGTSFGKTSLGKPSLGKPLVSDTSDTLSTLSASFHATLGSGLRTPLVVGGGGLLSRLVVVEVAEEASWRIVLWSAATAALTLAMTPDLDKKSVNI